MQSKCISKRTIVGLEGGEFILHPQAAEIMAWFRKHHPNYTSPRRCSPKFAKASLSEHKNSLLQKFTETSFLSELTYRALCIVLNKLTKIEFNL